MRLDRRSFIAGLAAAAATATLAPVQSPAAENLPLLGVVLPRFFRETAHEAPADWLEECAYHSEWHFDSDFDDDVALIQHMMTKLTYWVTWDHSGEASAIQVSTQCCPADVTLDPDYIVGHAARLVATGIRSHFCGGPNACFRIEFPLEAAEPWLAPIIVDAPQIPITLLPPTA